MKNLRIIVLATCCALAARAWANAGLTSAGVDPTAGNNTAQNEPTLAQVAPVANQGQPGTNAGTNAGVVLPVTGAGAQGAGANAQHAAAGAAPDASKTPATAVVAAPTPPPPPPDPSTLPVSVIRPLNKAPESTPPPTTDTVSPLASKAKPTRQPPVNAPAEPKAEAPAPPRVTQPAPVRSDTPRTATDTAAVAPTAATSATADGSANGYVFYTGVGIAGIILALSFLGFMRAGTSDSSRPRA